MADFIQSGMFVSAVLVALAAEIALASLYFWRRRQVTLMLSFIANGLAGAALILALRSAIGEAGWRIVAIYLVAALLAHVADAVLRLSLARRLAGPSGAD
ncbi:hypothetical protein [Aestuariivirga sp.]|jgi:hypothetical protein|uniref:hypothetical protein n=1 Tax=Aestuariivirga sp. TaxID=2650926 RepID=UPI0037841290